jgi:hypothetical protein
MPTNVNLPCSGNTAKKINKVKDTINFTTDPKCSPFVTFGFVPTDPPQGFKRLTSGSGGATVSYSYDGSQLPDGGYTFAYTTTGGIGLGNGTGVIKNN